jgi:hypothetical protein
MGDLKLGRLPQRKVGDRFDIQWAHQYLTVPVPPPVYPIDVSRGITEWGMLGNDRYGDCGEAGQLHYQMATGAPSFTDLRAIDEYLAYTGGQDNGVVLADFLLWLYRKGEILAFAPVDLKNKAQADSLTNLFRGLYVGVSLTDDAQQLFQNGIWTTANGQQPNPNFGHCILKTGVDALLDTYVTWGALQKATVDWSAVCADEGWVIITTQDQAANVDMTALDADINALGGMGRVAPSPAPQGKGCNSLGFLRGILGSGGG